MSIIKYKQLDKFNNIVRLNDFICHFHNQKFDKWYLRFGRIYKITDRYIYYKDREGIERRCIYYNCVKVSGQAYYNLKDQWL